MLLLVWSKEIFLEHLEKSNQSKSNSESCVAYGLYLVWDMINFEERTLELLFYDLSTVVTCYGISLCE